MPLCPPRVRTSLRGQTLPSPGAARGGAGSADPPGGKPGPWRRTEEFGHRVGVLQDLHGPGRSQVKEHIRCVFSIETDVPGGNILHNLPKGQGEILFGAIRIEDSLLPAKIGSQYRYRHDPQGREPPVQSRESTPEILLPAGKSPDPETEGPTEDQARMQPRRGNETGATLDPGPHQGAHHRPDRQHEECGFRRREPPALPGDPGPGFILPTKEHRNPQSAKGQDGQDVVASSRPREGVENESQHHGPGRPAGSPVQAFPGRKERAQGGEKKGRPRKE